MIKYLSHDGLQAGRDPVTAVHVSIPSPNYAQWQIKWTTTVSNRLLVDVGFNHYQAHRVRRFQPGVKKDYGSPEWFAVRIASGHVARHAHDGARLTARRCRRRRAASSSARSRT